ncbi:cytochrome c oxidase subunit 2A [Oceanobacillus senegalensis]|nr:cytochrome c oxidase subunit 2A [Oceanobacillus senegalensis]
MSTKKHPHHSHSEKEPNLKGTLTSVTFVGLFIVVSWVAVFMLFLSR